MASRIGVYICHCGINIAATVDPEAVAEYAAALPHVVVARDYMYMCSDPGQEMIKQDIRDYDLNYPGLGTGIPYNFADINAMIHIYDRGRNGLDIKVDDIKGEINRAVGAVYDKVKSRYYGNVELLEPLSVFRTGGGLRPVYMAGFTVNVGSKTFREYIYVTSYKKHFIKIQITHPGSTSDDIVRNAFVNRLMSILSGGDVKVKRPEPKRSKPRIKRSKHEVPHLEDLELYKKK